MLVFRNAGNPGLLDFQEFEISRITGFWKDSSSKVRNFMKYVLPETAKPLDLESAFVLTQFITLSTQQASKPVSEEFTGPRTQVELEKEEESIYISQTQFKIGSILIMMGMIGSICCFRDSSGDEKDRSF